MKENFNLSMPQKISLKIKNKILIVKFVILTLTELILQILFSNEKKQ